MTPSKMLTAVEAKIKEANDDIMQLKFGCRIKLDAETFTVLSYEKGGNSFGGENTEYYDGTLQLYGDDGKILQFGDNFDLYMPKLREIEILGRPIMLDDVLRAIDKIHRPNFGTVATNGWMHFGRKRCLWIFGRSLTWHAKHAPETIQFLHDILCRV